MTNDRNRVGLVTFTFGQNYGCSLQRYALQKTCEQLGFSAKAILLSLDDLCKPNRPGTFRHYEQKWKRAKRDLKLGLYSAPQRRKKRAFAEFEKKFLASTKRFYSYAQIEEEEKELAFDAYLAGSDQIWNPGAMVVPDSYRFYMLAFAPSEKKIAYAPSLAVSKIAQQYERQYRERLGDFRFLSARETTGAKELERILGRRVEQVLDPTLLLTLDDWNVLADQARPLAANDYIFCYSLGNLEAILRKAKDVQKSLNRPILCFEETRESERAVRKIAGKDAVVVRNAGPCEFVNYMRNAACVVTDSYHGSIFPILFSRPFLTMMRDSNSQETSMNSRMETLFSTFGLNSRLFVPNCPEDLNDDLPVDFAPVQEILKTERKRSLQYLQRALETVAGN